MSTLNEMKEVMDNERVDDIQSTIDNEMSQVIEFDGDQIYLSTGQFNYITKLGVKSGMTMLDLVAKSDISTVINALFAMNKFDDAWDLINHRVDDINYATIKKCPYFRLDRQAIDVFKHLYDSMAIDDVEYMYLNVISGSLFDHEFWDKKFETCNSLTEVLQLLHESFNGLNPIEVGCVIMDDYLENVVNSKIQPDDVVDEYIIRKPSVLFSPNKLTEFVKSGNVKDGNYVMYIKLSLISDDESTSPDSDEYKKFFTELRELSNDLKSFNIDNEKHLMAALSNIDIFKDDLTSYIGMIINSGIAPLYMNSVAKVFYEKAEINIYDYVNSNKLSTILADINMPRLYQLNMVGIDTSDYIIMPSVKYASYCAYNKTNDMLLFGDAIYSYEKFRENIKTFDEFCDDPTYEYHEISEAEQMWLDASSSENEFTEFMYSVINLFRLIDNYKYTIAE